MSQKEQEASARLRWARLRFSIIGQLLSAPPEPGELARRIAELAAQTWRHPSTGVDVRFSTKSIERWYYLARNHPNPIEALGRKVASHAGTHPSLTEAMVVVIKQLRHEHPTWSAKLLYDNFKVVAYETPQWGPVPGYATLCRYMRHNGLGKRRKPKRHEQDPDFVPREKRLFEVGHVHGLWHCDFHDGKRKVLTASGALVKVVLLVVMDDRSRLCCHAQWYVGPGNTQNFIHGLCQALQKRGLPRGLLSDNGGPMLAEETREGLERLSIKHHTTLSQTPEQNGKQEVFFAQVEGRLMSMLEGEPNLTLEFLNRATQAWVEQEYQRHVHSETKQTPLERMHAGPSVGRPCPSSDELRRAFRLETSRKQRRSDGTITVCGVRYELPSLYRTLLRPTVRVARWDLSSVDLVDPRRGTHLAVLYPVDREKNAERQRRTLQTPGAANAPVATPAPAGAAPLLKKQMADHAAHGLPPGYLPLEGGDDDNHNNEE